MLFFQEAQRPVARIYIATRSLADKGHDQNAFFLFLTLKIAKNLTGFDPYADPYSYGVIQFLKDNLAYLKIDEKECLQVVIIVLQLKHIIIIRVSQVFL